MNTKALRQFGYGVYIVSAFDAAGRPMGCVVNTGMQLTSDPYRVMVAINRGNATYAAIKETRRFAVTCLTQAADIQLVGTFGFQTSAEINKFEGYEVAYTEHGLPYVTKAAGAVVECEVLTTVDVGTHEVIIGNVTDALVVDTSYEPMTYSYYHTVLRGTTPPKASAFIADEPPVAAAPEAKKSIEAEEAEESAESLVGAHFASSAQSEKPCNGAPTLVVDIEADYECDPVFEPVCSVSKAAPVTSAEVTGELPEIFPALIPDPAVEPEVLLIKHHFRCQLCGYVVETEAEVLPADFRCPMCGAGADRFTRID